MWYSSFQILIILLMMHVKLIAQNLVPNPSFENHTTCNFDPQARIDTNRTVFLDLQDWRKVQLTPDYIHICNSYLPNDWAQSNSMPRTDSGVVGLAAYYTFFGGIPFREQVQENIYNANCWLYIYDNLLCET
jgi:hypothetical protein